MNNVQAMKLGHMRLERFVTRSDAKLDNVKLAIIGLGQAGGKMAQEFARLGIFTLAINTAQSDLDDLTYIKKENKILLGTIGGASKDIRVGRQAILDNKDKVGEALQREEILNADFVFVIAGLGGGTGNGGLPTVLNALNNIRSGRAFKGKPTQGAIVSVPGNWEKRGLKKNAVAGLGAIQKLIQAEKIGSVLIVDNEKLANDFKELNKKEYDVELEWETYGNMTIASTIFETIVATSLPQVNAFDRSEWLDIFSTPGFITIGKQKLANRDYQLQELQATVQSSFTKSNIFADGYNFDTDAKIGAFIAIRPKNKIITAEHRTLIEGVMNELLKGAEVTHYGLINNSTWGTTHDKEEGKEMAILYSLAVVEGLPKRVYDMIQTIEEEERRIQQEKQKKNEKEADLSKYLNLFKEEVAATRNQSPSDPFDDGDLYGDPEKPKPKNKDPFDDDDLLP